MEPELRELLEPIIKDFISRFLELINKQEELNKDLADEIKKIRQEQESLKAQRAENNQQLNLAKDKLAELKLIQEDLNNQLKDELADYSEAKKEYEQKTEDIAQNLKDSEIEKQLVSGALSRAKKEAEKFKAQTEALQIDLAKNNQIRIELSEKGKYLLAKEKALEKKEAENTERANQLNDIDLKLKAREAEVDRLIKRHQLEEFIKGAK